MTRVTDTELDELLIKHKENPNDLDIINSIAIGYFQNYEKNTDKDDFDFFETADVIIKLIILAQWRWNPGL